jgi:hypothetical protein
MIVTRRVGFDPIAVKCSTIYDNLKADVVDGLQVYVSQSGHFIERSARLCGTGGRTWGFCSQEDGRVQQLCLLKSMTACSVKAIWSAAFPLSRCWHGMIGSIMIYIACTNSISKSKLANPLDVEDNLRAPSPPPFPLFVQHRSL